MKKAKTKPSKKATSALKKLDAVDVINSHCNLLETYSIVEGIYFSHHSGKFFEAVEKKGNVKPKYTCGGYGPEVTSYIFKIQCQVLDYDLIMEY